MSAAENKKLIRHVYAELSQDHVEPFIEKMAEDIRWTVIGTTKFSGTVTGTQNAIDKVLVRLRYLQKCGTLILRQTDNPFYQALT